MDIIHHQVSTSRMTKKLQAKRKLQRGLPSTPPGEGSRELELYVPASQTSSPKGLFTPVKNANRPRIRRWEQNQDTSPLLRVPVEIRMRIFAYVLAVGQIHIRYRPWQRQSRIKQGVADVEVLPGRFFSRVLDANENPWRSPAVDFGHSPRRITIISGVCRQLYAETAVLPFRLNAWSFESTRLMERYIQREKRLTAQQRCAVQTLVVRDGLSKAMENRFAGLTTLVRRNGKTLETHPLDPQRERNSRNWHTWAEYDWGLHW